MKLYITFGQDHTHRANNQTFDKDSVAEIECESWVNGRNIAFDLFGDKFATSYDEDQITERFMSHFPRGILKAN